MFERQSFSIGALGLVLSLSAGAQAPAGAPAGATGVCRDGTYSTAASKRGACSGHHGVQSWYVVDAAPAQTAASAPAPAASPAPTTVQSTPANSPAPTATPTAPPAQASHGASAPPTAAQAPGAAPGLVWLNSSSNVYHCPSDRYYGKTKNGSYMTESEAVAKGAHADHGKQCK